MLVGLLGVSEFRCVFDQDGWHSLESDASGLQVDLEEHVAHDIRLVGWLMPRIWKGLGHSNIMYLAFVSWRDSIICTYKDTEKKTAVCCIMKSS